MIYDDAPVEEFIADRSDATAVFKAFISQMPFEVIIENIETQFEDYINLKDKTNYVEYFLDQLEYSYEYWKNNESEESPEDYRRILDTLYSEFIDTMQALFTQRIGIQITLIEDDHIYEKELRTILTTLYEFFVLNARENCKNVVSYLLSKEDVTPFDRDSLLEKFGNYSPYLNINCPDFLKYSGQSFIADCYENFDFSGNFLEKFTPKFYENKDLYDECIALAIVRKDPELV